MTAETLDITQSNYLVTESMTGGTPDLICPFSSLSDARRYVAQRLADLRRRGGTRLFHRSRDTCERRLVAYGVLPRNCIPLTIKIAACGLEDYES